MIIYDVAEAYNYPGNEFREGNIPARKVKKLFVFGDSYADTGNWRSTASKSWKPPYGITFPGKPSGRFSDGRVLTDYIASYLGIRSPSSYCQLKNFNTNKTQYGINFAHGGTGVFKTLVDQPNMTTQIGFLQQLIDKSVFTTQDLSSSIALVSLAGNDYSAYLANNGSLEDLPKFTKSVINQLILDVKRINGFGIKKIGITGLEPAGCLPRSTASASYEYCNTEENKFSESHNQMLKQNLEALNDEAGAPVFIYLDLYNAFTSALKIQQKPSDCGTTDKNEHNIYVVCKNPKLSFFWDSIHPSNAGWGTVFSALERSLNAFLL
ncbi:hypothetical protein CDL12_18706 [Handroanthus impetiginosus]|uniref:Triacylglycerol lipase n=1 Tax=Handroanthus impetiginosus TaxID=429701 RepID=A0A2G9GTV9_9LAMI|nr:hypothetical protein CDL12_18706 [Handroanthus impetiginosus]